MYFDPVYSATGPLERVELSNVVCELNDQLDKGFRGSIVLMASTLVIGLGLTISGVVDFVLAFVAESSAKPGPSWPTPAFRTAVGDWAVGALLIFMGIAVKGFGCITGFCLSAKAVTDRVS